MGVTESAVGFLEDGPNHQNGYPGVQNDDPVMKPRGHLAGVAQLLHGVTAATQRRRNRRKRRRRRRTIKRVTKHALSSSSDKNEAPWD